MFFFLFLVLYEEGGSGGLDPLYYADGASGSKVVTGLLRREAVSTFLPALFFLAVDWDWVRVARV